MRTLSITYRALGLALLIQLLATGKAEAYIDPGSGSFFVQMLLAGLLGAGMAIKTYWGRIKAFFTGNKNSTPAPEDETSDT